MKKSIYVIQPTYRLMDGTLLKELPLFNYSYNLPIISAAIPHDWKKDFCLEYSEEIDFETDASVVMITSTGYDISHAVEIAREFRQRGKVIMFGAHMDTLSDTLMRNECHSVFYGYPTPSMMSGILSDILGESVKSEYQCGMNIDFPFDYDVFNNRRMWFVPVLASLGCRYSCSYCCYTPVYGGKYRLRHIENVIADLKNASEFGRPIAFLDANLYNNREYLLRLCQRIISEGLKIRWGGQCTINVGDDLEVLKLMRKAGCHMLFFGLETLDQKNMEQLNKSFDTAKYAVQIEHIHKAGIHVGAFFMLGLDEDTHETFENVYRFFQSTKVDVPYVHLLFPVPGTPLEKKLRMQNRTTLGLFEEYLDNKPRYSVPCSFAYFIPRKMSSEELEEEYLQLFKKLTRIRQILRRCITSDSSDAAIILMMNLEARRKYRSMIKAHAAKDKKGLSQQNVLVASLQE